MVNLNVLSHRYATEPTNEIFSEVGRIGAERDFWIAVLKAQQELGVDIPEEDVAKFEAARDAIDLVAIEAIERRTKHDVKAKIEAFVAAAGAAEALQEGGDGGWGVDLGDVVEVADVDAELHGRGADDGGVGAAGEPLLGQTAILPAHRAVVHEDLNTPTGGRMGDAFGLGPALDEDESLLAPC